MYVTFYLKLNVYLGRIQNGKRVHSFKEYMRNINLINALSKIMNVLTDLCKIKK